MTLKFESRPLPLPTTALDASYVWGKATKFQQYGGMAKWYLVAFEMPMLNPEAKKLPREHSARVLASADAQGLSVWWNARFVYGTAIVARSGLARLEEAAVAGLISRFEVALAPQPTRPAEEELHALEVMPGGIEPAKCDEALLLGLVDHGCPFADTRLRLSMCTRILNFWDQEGAFAIPNGGAPAGFNFGFAAPHMALDKYIGATSPTHDWALYLEAGLPGLCRDASHGAHVLGCLLGAHDKSSLLWNGVYDHVPAPAAQKLPANPDVVFVQLPSTYLQGVPRTALAPYRLAGLRYILECAGPNTRRVVVPVASENYEGSHDGQSLYDMACDALVDFAKNQLNLDLALIIAGGNSLRTNTNDRVTLAAGARHDFTVRLLPGSERYTVVELWMPQAMDQLEFDLQPPGSPPSTAFMKGDGVWVAPDPAGHHPFLGIVSLGQYSTLGLQRCVTFFIPPTQSTSGYGGDVGDWRISVKAPSTASGDVYAWIARNTPAVGGKRRGYQSIFPRKYSWDWDFATNTPSDAGAARPYDEYSVSGLATASKCKTVGGYRLRSGERALYSAGGPGRRPSVLKTFRLDCSAPSDESRVVPGILGWGNRSAGYVRLAGTSVATPFAARVFARLSNLPTGAVVGRSDPPIAVGDIIK